MKKLFGTIVILAIIGIIISTARIVGYLTFNNLEINKEIGSPSIEMEHVDSIPVMELDSAESEISVLFYYDVPHYENGVEVGFKPIFITKDSYHAINSKEFYCEQYSSEGLSECYYKDYNNIRYYYALLYKTPSEFIKSKS